MHNYVMTTPQFILPLSYLHEVLQGTSSLPRALIVRKCNKIRLQARYKNMESKNHMREENRFEVETDDFQLTNKLLL